MREEARQFAAQPERVQLDLAALAVVLMMAVFLQEIEANAEALDESVLANAFAWMRKAKSDNLDGTFSKDILFSAPLETHGRAALQHLKNHPV